MAYYPGYPGYGAPAAYQTTTTTYNAGYAAAPVYAPPVATTTYVQPAYVPPATTTTYISSPGYGGGYGYGGYGYGGPRVTVVGGYGGYGGGYYGHHHHKYYKRKWKW